MDVTSNFLSGATQTSWKRKTLNDRDTLAKLLAKETVDLPAAYRIVDLIEQLRWRSPTDSVVERRVAWHEGLEVAADLHENLGKQAANLPKRFLTGPEQDAVEAAITASTGLTYGDFVLMITGQVHRTTASGLRLIPNPYEAVDKS